ncbi:hypothetical protein ACFZDM_31690 [Streptomyces californicus]|uniref:hypothetical protein n=1 Tax=Streptomyces californicus TaxID=67351 RepID=UPI0036F078F1
MNHLLRGLAANENLPPALVDRLIAVADEETADRLAVRSDLSHHQAVALAGRVEESAVRLAYEGRLTAADIDPRARPDVALALLDTGAGPAAWARRLAADPVVEHREKLAACPDLPPDVLDTLLTDPETRVVAEAALRAPAHVAARLAAHPRTEVRRAVAANDATPPSALASLLNGDGPPAPHHCPAREGESPSRDHGLTPGHDPAPDHCPAREGEPPSRDHGLTPGHDPAPDHVSAPDHGLTPDHGPAPEPFWDGLHTCAAHELIRAALHNPATPAEAVTRFADHPSRLLRWPLAARRDLTPEAYETLARDPVPGIRAELAENPAIGDDVMRALADDACHDVRRALAGNPRVPFDVLTRLAGGTRTGTAPLPRIASASPAEIAALAASADPAVRMLAARRRDLPAGLLDALAADPDAKVAGAVASHPGLAEPRLRDLARRHGVQVIAGIAANPDATPALLAELVRRRPPARKALRAIAGHANATVPALLACLDDPEARVVAAGHPALPTQVITALVEGADHRSAEAAAANPSLPRAVMTELLPPAPAPAV